MNTLPSNPKSVRPGAIERVCSPSPVSRQTAIIAAAGLCLSAAAAADLPPPPDAIAKFFAPPPELANDFGDYSSLLIFDDGSPVDDAADWNRRREKIRGFWMDTLGPWPPARESPRLETLATEQLEGFSRRKVKLPVAPGQETVGYLLVPDGADAAAPLPAMVVVYYEPETAAGLKDDAGEGRDFAVQLAKRGFAMLSIGSPYTANYPTADDEPPLQPLSFLAYVASNARRALAAEPVVDAARIGVMGYSYGGKWAMFAAALDDEFACGVWSDPGIVFDEARANVNYWEPWYLGFERGTERERGIPTDSNPRTGPYRDLIAAGRDLHELHALIAPRPFLVSGGSEDPPERWQALNRIVELNNLLGFQNRVAMTNRPGHNPTPESNAQLAAFLEWALISAR